MDINHFLSKFLFYVKFNKSVKKTKYCHHYCLIKVKSYKFKEIT